MAESEPTSRSFSWVSLCLKKNPDLYSPGVAYKFSNNREFLSTDKSESGIYLKGPFLELAGGGFLKLANDADILNIEDSD